MGFGRMNSATRGRRSLVSFHSHFINHLVYHQGLLSILQRILTFMNEEDAFWALVGIVKAFSNVLTYDFKENADQKKQL